MNGKVKPVPGLCAYVVNHWILTPISLFYHVFKITESWTQGCHDIWQLLSTGKKALAGRHRSIHAISAATVWPR